MPNIKSAKKRVAINQAKNLRNKAVVTQMRTAIKKFNAAIDSNNIEEAERLLPDTFSIIDTAASKGVIHKNNAAGKKSGLAKRLSGVKSGAIVIRVKKDNKTIAAEKALAAKESREAVRLENAQKAAERAAQREEEKAKATKKPAAKKETAKKEVAKKEVAKKEPATKTAAAKEPAKKSKDAETAAEAKPAKKETKKPLKKLSDKL